MSSSTSENHVCTNSTCADGDDEQKIKCSKCKRMVHYVCTNLPIYQLQLFFTKNYRGFICSKCVDIPEELKKLYQV